MAYGFKENDFQHGVFLPFFTAPEPAGLNWMEGIFKAMGWIGNLLYFMFIVSMALALMGRVKRAMMNEPQPTAPAHRRFAVGRAPPIPTDLPRLAGTHPGRGPGLAGKS